MQCACSLFRPTVLFLSVAYLVMALVCTSCERQPPGAEGEPAIATDEAAIGTETRLTSAAVPAPETPAAGLVPQDDDDDPGAPACLPLSDTVPGWIKTHAIRVEPVEEYLRRLSDSCAVAQMRPYDIVDVAACTYEKRAGNRRWCFSVRLFRCHSSADAYGLCSTQRLGTRTGTTSLMWTDRTNDGFVLHAGRSDYYIRVSAGPADDEMLLPQAEQFIGRILLALPKTDPPPLVRTLPSEARQAGRTWFAPTCVPLTAPGARLLTAEQAAALDDILGTSRARGLAAAAYQNDSAEPPDIVWLIEYRTPGDARSAYARYKNLLDRRAAIAASTPAVPDALLLSPVGRFLAGSWSPEEESVMHVLPVLQATLTALAGRPE
jgi:hypothetical protein